MSSEERRVVVTGMGAVCPLGRTVRDYWDNLVSGKTSVRDVSLECPWLKDYPVRIGSLFRNYEFPAEKIGIKPKDINKKIFSPFTFYSLEAAYEAINDSGFLDFHHDETCERTGVCLGVGLGGLIHIEDQVQAEIEKGFGKGGRALFMLSVIPDAAPGYISMRWGLHASESKSVGSACASGLSSLKSGYEDIMQGYADVMVCGGTGESASKLIFSGFNRLRALSKRNNDPEAASRPFDKDRDGFVVGEGAGILILEELQRAKERGAKIYGEILGFGVTSDGSHFTEPNLDYVTKAITMALKRSKLDSSQVDYINCHGTSTHLNDSNESNAIKLALGDHAYKIDASSTKGAIGHTISASGGLETIATLMSLQSGVIPPTRNLQHRDIEAGCNLNYTNVVIENKKIKIALKNALGFFGHNVVIALGKC